MTYIFEITETEESQPLIAHLKTLKYVKQRNAGIPVLTDQQMAKAIKKAEKSRSIAWEDFKLEAETWKGKFTS